MSSYNLMQEEIDLLHKYELAITTIQGQLLEAQGELTGARAAMCAYRKIVVPATFTDLTIDTVDSPAPSGGA